MNLISKELLEFNKLLDNEPNPKDVKVNEEYGNKYLPLRKVEELLKTIYGAVQYVKSGNIMIVGNNAVYSLDVVVFHPVLKEWLTYNGVSSVPITVDKEGKAINLHSHLPMAKAFAITNAARYIGRAFGSHLNEDDSIVVEKGKAAGLLNNLK